MAGPLEIFFSYAHEDEELMNDVRRQLIVFERNGHILKWHDRMIPAGAEWRTQIDYRLRQARIILLFMSAHFIESRYCYEVEGQVALERHRAGKSRVLPIVLKPCAWEATPFGELQALPADARPISRWSDRDEACLDAARGVMNVVDQLSEPTPVPAAVSAEQLARAPQYVYCGRCGHLAGAPSGCTGVFVHHDFVNGSATDYCGRCGATPGMQTTCTGIFIEHAFVRGSHNAAHCRRCGARPGSRSTCTGVFTHHEFTTA